MNERKTMKWYYGTLGVLLVAVFLFLSLTKESTKVVSSANAQTQVSTNHNAAGTNHSVDDLAGQSRWYRLVPYRDAETDCEYYLIVTTDSISMTPRYNSVGRVMGCRNE